MLTPSQLLSIPEPAEAIAEELHDAIIKRIVDAILHRLDRQDNYILTARDKWMIQALQDAGYLREEIIKDIAKYTGLELSEIHDAFIDAGVSSFDYDTRLYQDAGLLPPDELITLADGTELLIQPESLTRSPYYLRLMERNATATANTWQNFTRTTADAAQQLFIKECDKAYNLVTSGAISRSEAVKVAINEIVRDGVTVQYPSGHTDTIETVTLRAVRTGIAQMSGEITLTRMDETGVDLVMVSSHLGARPSHSEFQGHIFKWNHNLSNGVSDIGRFEPIPYKMDGDNYPDFISNTGYGLVDGLCGANCRHSFMPYFKGQKNPFEQFNSAENKKRYDMEQHQRSLERRIRATKREVMGYREAIDNAQNKDTADALEEVYKRKSALLQKQNAAYNDYCQANGLKKRSERITIAKWDRAEAAKARGAAQRYINEHK